MYVKMPPQVYAGREPPHPSMMQPICNDRSLHWKPLGGLWTSSHHPELVSEWLDWCDGNKFGDGKYQRAWLLQPAGAWVAVVRTPDDLTELVRQYQRIDIPDDLFSFRSMRDLLDYERMAEDFDALWLPNPHPYRFDASLFFNVFDVESTIWFRWNFYGEPEELEVTDGTDGS